MSATTPSAMTSPSSSWADDFVLVQNVLSQSNSTQRTDLTRRSVSSLSSLAHHPVVVEDEDGSGTDVASDDESDEEMARARQRRLRELDGVASDEESILFRGTPAPEAHHHSHNHLNRIATESTRDAEVVTPTREHYITPHAPKPTSVPSNPTQPAHVQPITLKPAAKAPDIQLSETQRRRARRARALACQKNHGSQTRTSSESDSGFESSTGPHSSSESSDDAEFGDGVYQEAVACISEYLKHPPESPSSAVRLHLMQSIIIELGLLRNGGTLPTSCNAAKAMIKNKVHINVKDYIARRTRVGAPPAPLLSKAQRNKRNKKLRAQGLPVPSAPTPAATSTTLVGVVVEELQKLMFPSKSALMKSLKSKKAKMPREWIKRAGLGVFLVTVFH